LLDFELPIEVKIVVFRHVTRWHLKNVDRAIVDKRRRSFRNELHYVRRQLEEGDGFLIERARPRSRTSLANASFDGSNDGTTPSLPKRRFSARTIGQCGQAAFACMARP
jgi:hypothetical protein